jgi:SAM-dependent MidA family methyltransferase
VDQDPAISFEDFMQRALHDPRGGYYARNIRGVGGRADFTTVPMVSHSLARAIASWAIAAMRESGCRNLIEIGPGEGLLAAGVLANLPWLIRRRTALHLVERSAPLIEKQRAQLGERCQWHDSLGAALQACGGSGIIYSNEVVDAFPVRLFEKCPEGWREIGLRRGSLGRYVEAQLPLASLPPSSHFEREFAHGQRVEVHASYRSWLGDWMPLWKAGRMLTIDYGATVDQLYQRQPNGSLRAYWFHQRLTGEAIYQNPGHQDITADVNFTDLIRWSEPWTHSSKLMPLAEFLHGFASPDDPIDRALLDPNGAGNAFLVLDQRARGSSDG